MCVWGEFGVIPRECDVGYAVEGHVYGGLRHKQEGLIQEEKMTLVGLQRALDSRLLVMADKVAGRHGDLSTRKALEYLRDDLVGGVLVVHLELSIVLLLECVLGDVEIEFHILFALELHDQERILGLSLAQRGLEADHNHMVNFVGLGEQEKLLDVLELNLVVVSLTTEAE